MVFMSNTQTIPTCPMKLLIITSSGGGGLLQAAIAKEQQAKIDNPKIQIIKKDVLRDWVGKKFGHFCTSSYNKAQQKGDVKSITFFCGSQWIFDYMCWPIIFMQTLKVLFRENIDQVIDTQNLCTSAILKAIRFFNYKRSKQIRLEKIIVDLPTNKATHFFGPIKRLSQKDKLYLHLKTILPLLETNQTLEDFWQKNCGLSNQDIHYEDLNVRQSFKKLQGKPRNLNDQMISLHFQSEEELESILRTCQKGDIHTTVQKDTLQITISKKMRMITLLLGSQPANSATVNYVKHFINLAKEHPLIPVCFFVFCGEYRSNKDSLFQRVIRAVQEEKEYPPHFSVIPFSFQSDNVIASLFHRSNLTCSRSGGQTAMELMAVGTGEIWIHSEAKAKNNELSYKDLLEGIPNWESESAVYLQRIKGAKIVTPEIFLPHARSALYRS